MDTLLFTSGTDLKQCVEFTIYKSCIHKHTEFEPIFSELEINVKAHQLSFYLYNY